MDTDPLLGVSVKANLNSGIGRFGLIATVGGSAGAPESLEQDAPALPWAGGRETGPTRIRVVRRIREVRRALR